MSEQRTGTAAITQTDPETEFAELDVDAPRVGIIMGSKSDMPEMEKAGAVLEDQGIRYEVRVMSAHRDPETVAEYCRNARMRGLKVIIAGAGLAAALPGVAAAHTDLPVIGVPLSSRLSALDRHPPLRSPGCARPDGRRCGRCRGRRTPPGRPAASARSTARRRARRAR